MTIIWFSRIVSQMEMVLGDIEGVQLRTQRLSIVWEMNTRVIHKETEGGLFRIMPLVDLARCVAIYNGQKKYKNYLEL